LTTGLIRRGWVAIRATNAAHPGVQGRPGERFAQRTSRWLDRRTSVLEAAVDVAVTASFGQELSPEMHSCNDDLLF
jgi:hypothetical protein